MSFHVHPEENVR